MAKLWERACKDAFDCALFDRDKYAYFYGAKGQVLTRTVMQALWDAEPEHFKKYSATQKEEIFRNSEGKIGLDCSGFVCRVTGETGYSVEIYGKRTLETSFEEAMAGQFLFTTKGGTGRHIGLYVGHGIVIDMGWEATDENVAKGIAGVRVSKLTDTHYMKWEHCFQTAAVDYTGSYASYIGEYLYVWDNIDYTSRFDPYYYAERYKDLKKACGYDTAALLSHFVTYGIKEGRVAKDPSGKESNVYQYVYKKKDFTPVFNPRYYADRYADLKAAFGYNTDLLLRHYYEYGIREGRKAKA